MRLIDADLLLAVVETGRSNIPIPDSNGVLRKYLDWDGVKHLIERVPTIDAAPVVHARWNRVYEDWRHQMAGNECSACGFVLFGPVGSYCSRCGAKMDGGASDE